MAPPIGVASGRRASSRYIGLVAAVGVRTNAGLDDRAAGRAIAEAQVDLAHTLPAMLPWASITAAMATTQRRPARSACPSRCPRRGIRRRSSTVGQVRASLRLRRTRLDYHAISTR